MSLFVRGLQITAVSLVVVVALFTVVQFVKTHTTNQGAPSLSQQKPPEPQPSSPIPQAPVRRVPINVDLAAFSPTRGDEKQTSDKTVHLPPQLLRVTFHMPVGMEPGTYALRLRDSAGNVYLDKLAPGRISDGATFLEVDIDLVGASPGSFTLMLRPPGLSWRRFPVVVQ
jgi:hypothetical protein